MAWGFGDAPQLSIRWALALCYFVGFRGTRLVDAVAVMSAESLRYPKAWHENLDEAGQVKSIDRGLFQINNKSHPSLSDYDAFRPIANARYAREISNRGRNWKPWAAYGTQRYAFHRIVILAIWALGTWKLRVKNVERKLGP